MVLIAARVAEIHMSADETLLVAQQNHNLEIEKDMLNKYPTHLVHTGKSQNAGSYVQP